MTKTLKIMDYRDKKVSVKINNFENVIKITISVVSGDEIMNVLYKDYTEENFDSCYMLGNYRIMGFNDGEYCIYDKTKNRDEIKKWNKRKTSYDSLWEEENE